ncbi:peptidoglycan -binding protein [Parasulfitobacter algicola]|uniref:Peptidoglycan -binding protein n=1 Tax=Parasulfitobacter algicola TaxID=2614809 RepID=A0ABX2IXD3_9RHOB|nr:peptidoglycan -binding protein [Sulfitobacter algicola]NSX54833.1 peptidoglycan -binding protein [Sulfitobacter algicola]
MSLSRRTGQRFQASIWPGFVDAMTALLLVLMFVLTIFMVVQFMLRETITGQESELDALASQVMSLSDALGLEQDRATELQEELGQLTNTLTNTQSALEIAQTRISEQDQALADAQTQITGFEAQVATLLSQQANLNASLAEARDEIDAEKEAARLAAARRQALEALIADLEGELETTQDTLTLAEAARLAEAAAAQALRDRLQGAEDELIAMTLSLEEQRRQAEETLTLLAAAEAQSEQATTEVERREALLAIANDTLSQSEAQSAEDRRKLTLMNQQIAALRSQMASLQGLIDASAEADRDADVQIEALGTQLNSALARAASEERRRRQLEEAERKRLEAEAQNLERYRSEFFGRMRDLLGAQEGVRIVGDRFVFSSEVLFPLGSASLSNAGRGEIAKIAGILQAVATDIPDDIDWVLQIDGHTDNTPVSRSSAFDDNWELSQARALSVVRYMVEELDIPPNRLSANGFGEYQPINPADTVDARAQNRRIELKFTEK